ncbi:hypothetical protein BJ742DRAFT_42795 [Cladochytrium replicatum]|nr:hypothetical protein BJ742DRAFT_42795 [Cladochytrium replicatum]
MSVGYQSRQPSSWFGDAKRRDHRLLSQPHVRCQTSLFSSYSQAVKASFCGSRTGVARRTCSFTSGLLSLQPSKAPSSALHLYQEVSFHATESQLPYWNWGIIGLWMFIILFHSILPIRERAYAWFLNGHIAIAILGAAGSLLHTNRSGCEWGYESWMFVTIPEWSFDCAVRLVRVVRKGLLRKAIASSIDDECVKIEVPGVLALG